MDQPTHKKNVTNSTLLKSNFPQKQKKMEKLLKVWIKDRLRKKQQVSLHSIKRKATRIFEKQNVKFGASEDKFVSNNSWFKGFRVRSNIPDLFSTNLTDADHLKEIISEDGYTAQQVYNVSEMNLSWKSIPGREQLDDKITVMIGCNAKGDHKLKPLFLNPLYLKPNNEEAVFEKWFYKSFIIDVENYCEENCIPVKVLLIINHIPCHSICVSHPNVKILSFSRGTFILPMNKGFISTVRASYVLVMLAELVEGQYKDRSFNEFLKSYHVKQAKKIMSEAWNMIPKDCLKASWKKLCPYFVNEEYSENGENLTQDILKYAELLQMPINFNDVTEFLNDQGSDTQSSKTVNFQQSDNHSAVRGRFDVKEMALAFYEISSALERFKKMDPDYSRFLNVRKGVDTKMKCYKTIYESMKTNENSSALNLELDKNLPSMSSHSKDILDEKIIFSSFPEF